MKRTPLKRSNPARKKKNWERSYGSQERVLWVQSLPCVICSSVPSENAHVGKNAGMGRKGDHTEICPLCPTHHGEQHQIGILRFERKYEIDLAEFAARVAEQWEGLN